jgi:hypothetical protein
MPGSYIPYQSLNQGHTTFMPNTSWAVSRHPQPSSGAEIRTPVLMPREYVSTRHQRFAHVRLLDSHLTEFDSVFSNNAHHGSIWLPQLAMVGRLGFELQ